jgi:hypothetical protein
MADRSCLVRLLVEDIVIEQLREPGSQGAAGCTTASPQILEPAYAEKRVAEDQKSPSVADYGQGAGNRAVEDQG